MNAALSNLQFDHSGHSYHLHIQTCVLNEQNDVSFCFDDKWLNNLSHCTKIVTKSSVSIGWWAMSERSSFIQNGKCKSSI